MPADEERISVGLDSRYSRAKYFRVFRVFRGQIFSIFFRADFAGTDRLTETQNCLHLAV